MKNTPLEDIIFVILLVLAAIMGFFAGKLQGSQEIRAQALYFKHAQNVVIWIANFKVTWGEIRDVTVKPEIKDALDSAVRNAVNKVVADAVSEGLKTWGSEDLLERIIDKRIGVLVEEKIRAGINERLEKLKIA